MDEKKAVTMDQLLESARQGEALTIQVAQAAQTALEGKQVKLTGAAGQVVGFDAKGNAVAGPVPPAKQIHFSDPTDNDSTSLMPNSISPRIDIGFIPGVGTVNKITGYYFLNQDGTEAQLYIGEPRSDVAAATKKYVDDAVDGVLPPGGTTGQALVKASDEDRDVEWGSVGASLIAITFGEDCLGQEYTVSAGDEVYTGTVEETLQSVVSVKQPNTEYTITCGEISKNVVSGPGFGPMKNVNMFDFYKLLLGVANADWNTERAQLLVEQDGDVASPRALMYDSVSGFFTGYLPTPGEWKITAKKFDIDYTQEFRGTSTVFIKGQKTILTVAPIWGKCP